MSLEQTLKDWQAYMEQLYSWISEQYNLAVNGQITQEQYESALQDYNSRMNEAQKAVSEIQAYLNTQAQAAPQRATQTTSSASSTTTSTTTQIQPNQFDTSSQVGRAAENIIAAFNTVGQSADIKHAMLEEIQKIRSMSR